MRRALLLLFVTACGDASVEEDPRCAMEATLLGTHPHAIEQPTALGKTISDTRGWNGVLYFGYGDIELNTGPIYITTFEPLTKTWQEHPISYFEAGTGIVKSTPAFYTHAIERFLMVGDTLWAPAAQPYWAAPFDQNIAPEYAFGTANHEWTQVDVAPSALHVVDAIERAPGDVYLTGSAIMDGSIAPVTTGRPGGHIWRSVDGGPMQQIFPRASPNPNEEWFDLTGAWIWGAALNGIAYMTESGFIYKHDGTNWDFYENFGSFTTPATFAGHLVFADLGQFFAFDGTKRSNLDFRFFESPGRYQGAKEPLALFQVTEGKLLAVRYSGVVVMTEDLENWTCIGKVPADASSIGSLDGTVYFGSVNGDVYGFPEPSW